MKNFARLTSVFFALALASLTAAPGPPKPRDSGTAKPAPPPTPDAPLRSSSKSVTPPQPAITGKPAAPSDSTIERSIQARFARSKISTDGFTVRVQGGVAVLEGKTGVMQHKGTATRLAKSGGARRVDNRIEISEAARQRAVANLIHGKTATVKLAKGN